MLVFVIIITFFVALSELVGRRLHGPVRVCRGVGVRFSRPSPSTFVLVSVLVFVAVSAAASAPVPALSARQISRLAGNGLYIGVSVTFLKKLIGKKFTHHLFWRSMVVHFFTAYIYLIEHFDCICVDPSDLA